MEQKVYSYKKKLYIENKKTMQEIQDITGINRKRVSKILKEQGITSRFRISDEQLKEAIKLYKEGKSFAEIAKLTECERHSIATKLRECGAANSFKKELTEKEKNIIKEYKAGKSMKELAIKYDMVYKTVQQLIRSERIERHTIKKYDNCNTDAFKIIDTEEKAYWLGFLYADGYVHEDKGVELTLKAEDLEHIKKFKTFMKSEHKISYRKNVNAYRIHIPSKEVAQDLIKLGCVQCKSLILTFPTEEQVSKHLIHHFMRGYFDGDGCISINREKCRYHFSVLGTKEFLEKYEIILMEYLKKDNKTKRSRAGKAYSLNFGGRLQILKIYDFLYKDATIYLERKIQKFAVLR